MESGNPNREAPVRHLLPLLLSAACIHRPPAAPPDPLAEFASGVEALSVLTPETEAAAYAHFTAALQTDPALVHAHYNAGWLAERSGDIDTAVQHYKNAWALRQADPLLQLAYAEALIAAHRPAEAAILLRDADTAALQQVRLEAMLAAGMPHEVLTTGRHLLLSRPDSAAIYRAMARAHAALAQPQLEALCLEKARAISPLDADLLNDLGVQALDQGDAPRAFEAFRSAQALDPIHRESNLNLGFMALDSGDIALARDSFESALQADPGSPEARIGLAVALRLQRAEDDARAVYDTLLRDLPKDPMVVHNAVMFHLSTADFDAARKVAQTYGKATNDPLAEELLGEIEARYAARPRHTRPTAHPGHPKRPTRKLDELRERRTAYAARIAGLEGCPLAAEAGIIEMNQMVLEQVDIIIDAEEASMVGDVLVFIDEMESMMPEYEAACAE